MKVEYIDVNLMMITLRGCTRNVSCLFTFTDKSRSDNKVKMYYDKIEQIIKSEKQDACIIIMGNWNAVFGEEKEKEVVENFGLGSRSETAERLANFYKEN